ncbi:hypothetical protein BDZ91DRAFT_729686, partial [Kalaharituber pfeilii]
ARLRWARRLGVTAKRCIYGGPKLRAGMATEAGIRRAEMAATRRGARSRAERFTGIVRER